MAHFVPNLIRLSLDNLKHDPNYVQSDEDEMLDSQESDMEDDEEFDGDDYSDDDDVSWKVRRAAAKLLTAVILQYPSTLSDIYRDAAPVLISRFNEREESVRVEIFAAFRELVRVTGQQGEEVLLSRDVPVGVGKRRRESSQSGERPPPPKALGASLHSLLPRMSKALTKQLAGNSVPTKLAGFALAREVVEVLGGGLGDVLPGYVRPIELAMEVAQSKLGVNAGGAANESNLKIGTLKFVKSIFKTHSAEAIGSQAITDLAKVVNDAIAAEKFYKVVAEALDTIVPIILALGAIEDRNSLAIVTQTVKVKMTAQDIDQEVREKSILALGTMLKTVGPNAGFDLLFDRLKIESVRLVTIKVIADVVEHTSVASGAWVATVVDDLSTYLRRTIRDVKAASLKALYAILAKFAPGLSQARIDNLVDNLAAVLNSEDTQLYPVAMDILTLIIQNCNPAISQIESSISPAVAGLFDKQAVQMQGAAWSSYGACLAAMAQKELSASLYARLVAQKSLEGGALAANAKAVATLLSSSTSPESDWWHWKTIERNAPLEQRLLRLMVIGEGGKLMYTFTYIADLGIYLNGSRWKVYSKK
jgi:cullin-associated NEDD8-dissociated protein 1